MCDYLTLVFFCKADSNWKIGDFGLVAPGSTVVAKTTLYGQGTAGYRAPEVLREDGQYTNKVDVFALGCILFEFATKTQAFTGDWAVRDYAISTSLTNLPVDFAKTVDENLKTVIVTIIHETLLPDPTARPSARGILKDMIDPFVGGLEKSSTSNKGNFRCDPADSQLLQRHSACSLQKLQLVKKMRQKVFGEDSQKRRRRIGNSRKLELFGKSYWIVPPPIMFYKIDML